VLCYDHVRAMLCVMCHVGLAVYIMLSYMLCGLFHAMLSVSHPTLSASAMPGAKALRCQ